MLLPWVLRFLWASGVQYHFGSGVALLVSAAAIASRWLIAAGWFLPVDVVVASGFVRGARLLVSLACALRPRRCKKTIYEFWDWVFWIWIRILNFINSAPARVLRLVLEWRPVLNPSFPIRFDQRERSGFVCFLELTKSSRVRASILFSVSQPEFSYSPWPKRKIRASLFLELTKTSRDILGFWDLTR